MWSTPREVTACSTSERRWTSATTARCPRRSAARPSAPATVDLPTPPLPETYSSRRSRRPLCLGGIGDLAVPVVDGGEAVRPAGDQDLPGVRVGAEVGGLPRPPREVDQARVARLQRVLDGRARRAHDDVARAQREARGAQAHVPLPGQDDERL